MYYSHQPRLNLVLFVDDLSIIGPNHSQISALQYDLAQEFKMKNLGLMRKFLGVQVLQESNGIFLHQLDYARQLLSRHLNTDVPSSSIPISPIARLCLDTSTPPVNSQAYHALIGQILYLTKTCPDVFYSAFVLSHFIHCPHQVHDDTAIQLLAYISKTSSFGL